MRLDVTSANALPIGEGPRVGCTWGGVSDTRDPSCDEPARWHVYDVTFGSFLCEEHAQPFLRMLRLVKR